jgi:hypothetical protein
MRRRSEVQVREKMKWGSGGEEVEERNSEGDSSRRNGREA